MAISETPPELTTIWDHASSFSALTQALSQLDAIHCIGFTVMMFHEGYLQENTIENLVMAYDSISHTLSNSKPNEEAPLCTFESLKW
mmetsp:Transcript_9844/g.19494  ORF Transcript_9844/g.19494 Transcript_9844/m.19494 type:complete len:87 (+) Transcript_9844:614-874(+)